MDGAAALRRRRAVRQDAGACMYSSRSASLRMYEKDVSNEASEQVSHTQLLLKLRWPKVISKETHSGVLFFGFERKPIISCENKWSNRLKTINLF